MSENRSPESARTVGQHEDRPGGTVAAPSGATVGTQVQSGDPTVSFRAPGLPAVPGYVVTRELARGGMGVVFAAHDPTFDREVAVKVMHPGQDAGRFVVESKVTAQLPHPGVPPVYALGELTDGRPFLAMKLIDGRTLADELRATTRADLPRLLDLFHRVCQTVGFAHSKGIIHRDLKPNNIMVGAFGEALVMDWGLAREVRNVEPGTRSEGTDSTAKLASSSHPALRTPNFEETVAGEVKGTPAYMAPEQARGETVDARADVFALGGILTALLTGKAPFEGTTVLDTVRKAAAADLTDAFARLDASGADAELVAVAKKCLAPRPADRYAHAEEAAGAVAAYRAGVEERLRRAERDRAAAEARAAEELNTRREAEAKADEQRARRRVQLALAASVLLLAAGVGAFAWWRDKQADERKLADEQAAAERAGVEGERKAAEARAETELTFKTQQARQGVAANLRLAADLRGQYKFAAAAAALAQAAELAAGAPELVPVVEQARRDLALVVELDDIRFRKWTWIAERGWKGRYDTASAPGKYRRALAGAGLDLMALEPADAAQRITGSAVRADLIAAVDDWALYEPNPQVRERLVEVARRADPGPWADRLRSAILWSDPGAVRQLASGADPAAVAPAALCALAALMRQHDLNPVLTLLAARAVHPTNFELAFVLAQWGYENDKYDLAVAAYEAARAIRPDNAPVWINLGLALLEANQPAAAIPVLTRALELDPHDARTYNRLGIAYDETRQLDRGAMAYKASILLDPNFAYPLANLASTLAFRGNRTAAVATYRRAIEAEPDRAPTHNKLGMTLLDMEEWDEAAAAFRAAIALSPTFTNAHWNLGQALRGKGDRAGAEAAYRVALRLEPRKVSVLTDFASLLEDADDLDGAVALYRAAIRLDPKNAELHNDLGITLERQMDLPGARDAYRAAILLDPEFAAPRNHLAWLLATGPAAVRNGAEAVEHATRACELTKWKDGDYLDTLAAACAEAGQYDRAIEYERQALSFPDFKKESGPEARARLALYRKKQPYRDPDFHRPPPAPPPRAVVRP